MKLPNNVTKMFYKTGLLIKKHSPEILVIAGVTGTVASAVMACKATTKAGEILTDAKEKIDQVHEAIEVAGDKYTEDDAKKDTTLIYAQTGLQFVKLYAPSVLMGALSITCILTSNNILKKRNVALAAAYATVDKTFKDYRNRVVDRFGKELDKELRYNIKPVEIKETVVDKNGKEKEVTKKVNVAKVIPNSDYARFFDEYCAGWSKDPEYNLTFLKLQQTYANNKLQAQGYLFLNDVYKMLGIPATKAGQVVGWIYDKDADENNAVSDNYVDFGIYDMYREDSEARRLFVNGYERSILLDFNVDGNILDML